MASVYFNVNDKNLSDPLLKYSVVQNKVWLYALYVQIYIMMLVIHCHITEAQNENLSEAEIHYEHHVSSTRVHMRHF